IAACLALALLIGIVMTAISQEAPVEKSHRSASDKTQKPATLEDLKIRQAELTITQTELAIKQAEEARSRWNRVLNYLSNPLVLAVVGGFIAFLLKLEEDRSRFRHDHEIERTRLNGNLVVEAVKTGNLDQASKNLQFLLDAGLLVDPPQKLVALLQDKSRI